VHSSFCRIIVGKLGDGTRIRFWIDRWIGDEPFCFLFPALFGLEADKTCLVKDRIHMENGEPALSWSWRRSPESEAEVTQLFNCLNLISHVKLLQQEDSWSWGGSSDGEFSVKSVREMIADRITGGLNHHYIQSHLIPKKINVFGWRAWKDRLPTKVALHRRNIMINSLLCPLCGSSNESLDHLLIDCLVASVVWQKVAKWCSLPPIQVNSVNCWIFI
jgi:hypothetical protein